MTGSLNENETTPLIDSENDQMDENLNPSGTHEEEEGATHSNNPRLRFQRAARLASTLGYFSSRTLSAKPEKFTCQSHSSGRSCPLCESYAANLSFWKDIIWAAVIGVLVSLVCFLFVEPMKFLPRLWTGEDYPKTTESLQLMNGLKIWMGILPCFGFGVGVLKILIDFPVNYDGFFKQVTTQFVHPSEAIKVGVTSTISVAGGAALGPSSVLGSIGGGIGQFVADYRRLSEEDVQQSCLLGMCAAMGALFPSPIIPMVMMIEIVPSHEVQGHYMKFLAEMGTALLVSYVVTFQLSGEPFLPFLPIIEPLKYEFHSPDLLTGLAIGIICGIIGTIQVVLVGLSIEMFKMFTQLTKMNKYMVWIVPPTLGGFILGVLAYLVPLGLGSGNTQILSVISHGLENEISANVLALSALTKMIAVALSRGSGFVGGLIFPVYFIGICLGFATFIWLDDPLHFELPLLLSCFMVGIPASLFPIPLTHLITVATTLRIGAYQTGPMFVACLTANCISSGSGAIANLMNFAKRRHIFDNPVLRQ